MKFFKTIFIFGSIIVFLGSAYTSYFFDMDWIFTTFLIVYAVFTAVILIIKGDLFMKKKKKEKVEKNGKKFEKAQKKKEEPQNTQAIPEPPKPNGHDEQTGKKGDVPIIPDDVKDAFLVDTEDNTFDSLDSEEDSGIDTEEETEEDADRGDEPLEPEPSRGEVRRGTSRRAEEIQESPDIAKLKDEINELQRKIDTRKAKILDLLGVV